MKTQTVKLGEVLDVQNGFAFKTEFFSESDGVPLIRIRDLGSPTTEAHYTGEYRAEFLVEPGDYLIGMDGNFRCHRWEGPKALLNQRVCRLRNFSRRVLPEYIFYGIQRQLDAIEATTSFATVKHISARQISNIELPVPPLKEQRRIVDLLSRAEGIVKLRREAQKKAAEIIPALFLDIFGDPARNPKRWPMQAIQHLCSVQTGATPRKEQARYYEAGTIPWVKTGEVCESHILEAEEQITDLAIRETNCKVFPVNTILIAMYGQGQTRGRAGMLKIPAATNQACAAILPGDKVDQAFLFEMLKMQYERLRAMGRGGNQANLNLGMIKALEVPCPPMDAQARFVAHITALESIRTQQDVASQRSLSTFEALLSKLFSARERRSNDESLEVAVA